MDHPQAGGSGPGTELWEHITTAGMPGVLMCLAGVRASLVLQGAQNCSPGPWPVVCLLDAPSLQLGCADFISQSLRDTSSTIILLQKPKYSVWKKLEKSIDKKSTCNPIISVGKHS